MLVDFKLFDPKDQQRIIEDFIGLNKNEEMKIFRLSLVEDNTKTKTKVCTFVVELLNENKK